MLFVNFILENKSYLRERKQCVHFEGFDCDLQNINTDVPQGSVRGSLLVYISIH